MKTSKRYLRTATLSRAFTAAALLCGAAVLTMTSPALAGNGNQDNPRVIPPHASPYGQSYGAWGSAWWQWALGVPTAENPVADLTGEHCDAGQSGPVWFLAGTFGGPTVRHCEVPAGKALFFPMINTVWENNLCVIPDPDPQATFEELRASAEADVATAFDLFCVVDGVPLKNLENYLASSPEPFDIVLGESNVILDIFGCPDALPGSYGPAAAAGYWIMLAPSKPGPHTIHFGGKAFGGDFVVDVTYHLTVVPGK